MSYAEDEGFDGWDFDDLYDDWQYCESCESTYPPDQEFCYKCLTIENKWKLGGIVKWIKKN